MKYPILLMAIVLLASFVVSETYLRDDLLFSQDHNINELSIRNRRSPIQPAVGQQPVVENINYRPYSQVPANIKQLLQFQQAREPLTHIASQQPPQLAKTSTPNAAQYNPQVQYGAQSQGQSHPQYQPQLANGNYQPQQSPIYQQNHQQIQPTYNPQQQQQQYHGNQQQVFRPEQKRLY